ncbi:MAG: recombinase family protein [candidate division Zixibacteria bacterium]|nr:recombinase family protein [candidate division Zixibacteria bacterium]
MTKQKIKAVGYCRVSTDEQAQDGLSLDYQQSRIKAYAESQDWSLIGFYVDAGYSGKNTNRPEFQRMISDLQSGKADILIVLKLDRITRKQRDLLNLLEGLLEPSGIGFKSVQESFDTSTGMGKAFIGMVSVFAQLEGDMISERTISILRNKRENGKWVGRIPYGFQINNGKLIEDLKQMEVIKRIKRLKNRGKTVRQISNLFPLSIATISRLTSIHLSKYKSKYLKGNGQFPVS